MTTDRRFATRTLTALIGPAFAVAALALLSMPAAASAQAGRGAVDEGNRLYEEGRYQEALERYLDALRENPESPLIRFNAGNALYQSQDFQRALEAYREAIESGDPALASTAWYNLGDALYQSGDLQGSAEAFKQALRLDPRDVDAKHNLERVLQQMQQQEQQQNPDGDSGENDEQENESDPNEQEQNDDPEAGEGEPGEESEGDEGENEDENEDENEGENDPDEQDPEEQDPDEQDPEEEESDADSDRAPGEGEPEGERGGRPMPQEGAMSREEAERLLAALDEDPGDVNRRSAAARGRIPRKKW